MMRIERSVQRFLLRGEPEQTAGFVDLGLVELEVFVGERHVHKMIVCEHEDA